MRGMGKAPFAGALALTQRPEFLAVVVTIKFYLFKLADSVHQSKNQLILLI